MQRLPLAQQIAQLEDVAPVGRSALRFFDSELTQHVADFDPEDVQVTAPDSDPDTVADHSAARAHYFDVGPSSLRKPHESLSDLKYSSTKTSRKLMLDESENDSTSEDAGSGSHVSEVHSETIEREADTRTTTNTSMEHPSTSRQNSDLSSSLRTIREDDRKKGKAISKQIALWDSLLDARIRLQKAVTAGNRMPPPSQDTANQQVHIALVKTLEEARLLSNEIFDFQESLLAANESIQPPRKRRRSTKTDCSVADYAEELREASHAVSELECTYHSHLVQTLNKWSSKIQAVAPSVLLPSNRNAFSRTTQHIKSAPQLIDETLVNHNKVLARTRIYRGKGSRLGVRTTDEGEDREKEDPEVFDDTDFYHQLLRDIIGARGDGTGGNDNWVAVQKEKKAKKNVDTRASKGRKIRYEVLEKIQNFMVPVPTHGSWHEEQIDELFASLLGKGFEIATQEMGETADESLQEEVNAALQGDFQVFG